MPSALSPVPDVELALEDKSLTLADKNCTVSTSTQIMPSSDYGSAAQERSASSLRPVDTGFGAMSFLASAFVVDAVVWGVPFVYGVFLDFYLEDPDIGSQAHASTLLPLAGTVSTGILYCSGPFIYPLISRHPKLRRIMKWCGIVLCFGSLLGASYATTVAQLVVLQGVVYAIGGSLIYAPTLSYLSEWFDKRRGIAVGIIFAGASTGGLIFPLFLPAVLSAHGTARTLRFMSMAVLVSLAAAVPFIRPRLPELNVSAPRRRVEQRAWLRDARFWIAVVANTIEAFGHFLPLVWLPTYATAAGISRSTSALTVSLQNGAMGIGQTIIGILVDKHMSPWILGMGILTVASAATFVLWGVTGHVVAGLLSFTVIYGLLAGGWSSLWTAFMRPMTMDDPTLATALMGFMMLTRGGANVLATPIANALLRTRSAHGEVSNRSMSGFEVGGGRFEGLIVYTGSCLAMSATVALGAWWYERCKTRG